MKQLSQFLKNIGVGSFEELTEEEKTTYKEWESSLNGRQITDAEVRQFLDIKLEEATAKLITEKLGEREDIFLKMKIDFIRNLNIFLDAPKHEKEQVENLIKQNHGTN
ncbi:hypothetical protein KAU11_08310 [Candidatus Babeliales bacterium]|nr:hypothetical protein [Candidatus Babeliales bacterium]